MRVHIAADHAGFSLKQYLARRLTEARYEVIDHGADRYNAEDDYPGFCISCAQAVATDEADGYQSMGVVLGGSGNGEQLAANTVRGIRAALVTHLDLATLARSHNDANVIALGARFTAPEFAWVLVRAFLNTPFSGEPRHVRRVQQLVEAEAGTG